MSLRKWQREITDMLEREGFSCSISTTGGNHLRLRISDGVVNVVCHTGKTPSDYRAKHNLLKDVRRNFNTAYTRRHQQIRQSSGNVIRMAS